MDLCEAIKDAKACAAKLAAKYSGVKIFGNKNEEMFYDMLRLNTYIRTLERNKPTFKKIKVKKPLEGTVVDFSSLKKQNNTLILDSKEEYICTTVEICPCLSDDEICEILEQVKMLCSNYNC